MTHDERQTSVCVKHFHVGATGIWKVTRGRTWYTVLKRSQRFFFIFFLSFAASLSHGEIVESLPRAVAYQRYTLN